MRVNNSKNGSHVTAHSQNLTVNFSEICHHVIVNLQKLQSTYQIYHHCFKNDCNFWEVSGKFRNLPSLFKKALQHLWSCSQIWKLTIIIWKMTATLMKLLSNLCLLKLSALHTYILLVSLHTILYVGVCAMYCPSQFVIVSEFVAEDIQQYYIRNDITVSSD